MNFFLIMNLEIVDMEGLNLVEEFDNMQIVCKNNNVSLIVGCIIYREKNCLLIVVLKFDKIQIF